MPVIRVPLLDALGLVLAEQLVATRDIPPFANSAMDGFACRASDLSDATAEAPVTLKISGTVSAGDKRGTHVEAGRAVRIMTGAPLPSGADVVVAFERTEIDARDTESVLIRRAAAAGTNVRLSGEDVRSGDVIPVSGQRIRPADIALMAAIGCSEVPVHRRPRIAILATGNEVVSPGTTPRPEQIWDSNSFAIAAMVSQAGGVPVPLGIVRDNEEEIRSRLSSSSEIDLIVTSGGVSAGDLDLIKDILRSDGKLAFWQVRIKPGRPLAFGTFGDIPLLGLPGNPVAVAVTFLQFVRPAILTMLGVTNLAIPTIAARMLDPVDNSGNRQHYVRVRITESQEGFDARLAGDQGAGILSTLSNADGLLVVPESMLFVEPGTILPVEMLNWEH